MFTNNKIIFLLFTTILCITISTDAIELRFTGGGSIVKGKYYLCVFKYHNFNVGGDEYCFDWVPGDYSMEGKMHFSLGYSMLEGPSCDKNPYASFHKQEHKCNLDFKPSYKVLDIIMIFCPVKNENSGSTKCDICDISTLHIKMLFDIKNIENIGAIKIDLIKLANIVFKDSVSLIPDKDIKEFVDRSNYCKQPPSFTVYPPDFPKYASIITVEDFKKDFSYIFGIEEITEFNGIKVSSTSIYLDDDFHRLEENEDDPSGLFRIKPGSHKVTLHMLTEYNTTEKLPFDINFSPNIVYKLVTFMKDGNVYTNTLTYDYSDFMNHLAYKKAEADKIAAVENQNYQKQQQISQLRRKVEDLKAFEMSK